MSTVLNLDVLRDITGGDAELEKHLFSLFFATAERCIAGLAALVERDDELAWHRIVHELKGASANIRAEAMAALCKDIEHLPTDMEERKRAHTLLQAAYQEVRAAVTQSPR